MKFYVISRASIPERSKMWRDLRDSGVDITSSWIDEAGPARIVEEIRRSDRILFYVEPGDFPLKGALTEAGVAIALGKPILLICPGCLFESPSYRPIGSWIKHPLVRFL